MSAWRCTNSAYASSSPRVARATSSVSSSGGPPRSEEDARIDATVTAQRVAGVDRRRVDDAFGSQLARELEMQCAAYDGDDVGAGKARKLRHHVTDATESEDSDALTG